MICTTSTNILKASAGAPNDKKDPLSLSLNEFTKALAINTTSAFAAAQQAVLAFSELPSSASKTFIYTGNCLNTTILAPLLAGGVGKSASAHMIHVASAAYADRGFKYVISYILLISLIVLSFLFLFSFPHPIQSTIPKPSQLTTHNSRFYYADERNPDGSPAYGGIDGEAHGKYYLELSEGESQGPWQQTFVKGAGYKDFSA